MSDMTRCEYCGSEERYGHTAVCVMNDVIELRAANERLRASMRDACALLAERMYGNPTRSPGHNARLCLESALAPATTGRPT